MKLIGSQPSPYVRRFRILLAQTDFEFQPIDVFGVEDRKMLKQKNPANRVPVLVDGDNVVFESRIMFRYLQQKLELPQLDGEQENLLSLIDAMLDSLIILLLSQRSGLDTSENKVLFKLQKDRIATILPVLEQAVEDGKFAQWDYLAVSLFTTLDWIGFRELWDISGFPALLQYIANNQQQPAVDETNPRND